MAEFTRLFPVTASSAAGSIAATASSGGGANAIATISATGSANARAFITGIAWSYSTTPAPGGLRLLHGTSSGAAMLSLDITAAGPDFFFPASPLGGLTGGRVTAELLQAGSSIIGKLNLYGYVK